MFDYTPLYRALTDTPAAAWLDTLPHQVERALDPAAHGDLPGWYDTLARLPRPAPSELGLAAPAVRIGRPGDIDAETRAALEAGLRELHPWRKGPFEVFGIHVDTEWHSDWKWARVAPHLTPLTGRRVLDIGCGNGYYGWRMLGAGAELVVGVDPTLRFVIQYQALQSLMGGAPANYVMPIGVDDVPAGIAAFDTVFSMGVLYHRRDPVQHLEQLKGFLRPGGELVLETLVLEGGGEQVLVPDGRYAQMRNVWAVPTVARLERWLTEAGLERVRTVDVTRTTTGEQRSTDWMRFHSLPQFLDPADPLRTIEGHPAPVRAVVVAERL